MRELHMAQDPSQHKAPKCQAPREALKTLVRIAATSLMLPSGESSSSRLLVINSFTGSASERSFLEELHVPLAHLSAVVASACQQGVRR